MAADIKQKYPASSNNTVALTITLASLATSSALLAGRQSTVVDNTSNLDLDHLVGGKVRLGTSPTVSTLIEAWAFAAYKIASGTPSYPDTLGASDAAVTITSANVKYGLLVPLWSQIVDNTTGRDYFMPPTSIAQAFGELPPYWGIWVTHSTVAALDSTGGNHEFHYHRIQKQTV
jgi:hypothetical protein